MKHMRAAACVAAATLMTIFAAKAHSHGASTGNSAVIDEKAALATSQQVIGREVRRVVLTNTAGQAVDIGELRGKPLVVGMIYTSCYHTCPLIAQSLRNAVEAAKSALGRQSFEVAMVGFDVAFDTPEHMAAFARKQGIDSSDWHILSGDQAAIDRLAADLGFVHVRSARGFDHLAQTTILDSDGRVHTQVYGDDFRAPAIVEPLKTLVFGRRVSLAQPSTLLGRIRLICTIYDPSQDRYRFSYAIFIGIVVGGASLIAVAAFVVVASRHSRSA